MYENLREIAVRGRDSSKKLGQRAFVAIESLLAALEKKEIYAVDLSEWKSQATYYIETAASDVKYQWAREIEGKDQLDAYFAAFPQQSFNLQSIKAWVTGLPKYEVHAPGFVPFVHAMDELKKLLEALKPMVKTGRKPKPVDPNAPPGFVKPVANFETRKKLFAFMEKVVAETYSKYEKLTRDSYSREVTKIEAAELKTYRDLASLPPATRMLAQRIVTFQSGRGVLQPDWPKIISDLAERDTKEVFDGFRAKIVDKVSLIAARKEIDQTKIVSSKVQVGKLESVLKFSFTDGTAFTITSQVEQSVSSRGVYFYRFPSRFSDVKMKDGTLMARPSEEKIIKEF